MWGNDSIKKIQINRFLFHIPDDFTLILFKINNVKGILQFKQCMNGGCMAQLNIKSHLIY